MVEPTIRGGDVALFIDWENFKISLAAGNRTPNLSSLFELLNMSSAPILWGNPDVEL